MKICGKCKRELPESMFHRRTESKDGLRNMCKECAKKYGKSYYSTPESKKRARLRNCEWVDSAIGGYKIFILNHVKKGEFKFNVVPTRGRVFVTNSKVNFIKYLDAI